MSFFSDAEVGDASFPPCHCDIPSDFGVQGREEYFSILLEVSHATCLFEISHHQQHAQLEIIATHKEPERVWQEGTCPEPCLQLSAQVQTLMNKLISIQNMLSCLPHSFIKKQSYGAPYLLIWSLDLSVVSSVFYFWFYSTSVQTAKCPDPLMGRHHIPLHLLLLTETSLTCLNLLLQCLFHLMLIHDALPCILNKSIVSMAFQMNLKESLYQATKPTFSLLLSYIL